MSVILAVRHQPVSDLIVQMLRRDHRGWILEPVNSRAYLGVVLAADPPDLVVADAGNIAELHRALHGFPFERVIVIGPESDASDEHAAARAGAGGWLPRERVADVLVACMRCVLERVHRRCPRRAPRRVSTEVA